MASFDRLRSSRPCAGRARPELVEGRAKLTAALVQAGCRVSSTPVGRLLHELGYRLQSVRKSQEGTLHPDRNAQFEHINAKADDFLQRGQPVVSVDTKKKEWVGDDTGLRIQVSHLPPGTSNRHAPAPPP